MVTYRDPTLEKLHKRLTSLPHTVDLFERDHDPKTHIYKGCIGSPDVICGVKMWATKL